MSASHLLGLQGPQQTPAGKKFDPSPLGFEPRIFAQINPNLMRNQKYVFQMTSEVIVYWQEFGVLSMLLWGFLAIY